MWFRILSISVFLALMIGAFTYFNYLEKPPVAAESQQINEEQLTKQLEEQYDTWWEEQDDPLDIRLTFKKKFAVVHVGELNTDVLNGSNLGNLEEHGVSINPETKAMYFYREELAPTESDNLIVVHDVHSLDVLLSQDVYKTADTGLGIKFLPFEQPAPESGENYGIFNEARLFNEQQLQVSTTDDTGKIRVELDSQTKELAPGEKATFIKRKKISGVEVGSKIVVTNYGLWDSQDITYVADR
jgi:hypothetical protein